MSRAAAAAVAALSALPWTVVVSGDDVGLVLAWGLVNLDTFHVTTLPAYLFAHTRGLPDRLLAWPVAVVLYGAALGTAAVGAAGGREDPRFTAGLLVLSGLSGFVFALGVGRPPSVVAVPTGTALSWLVAWWFYAPRLRR